MLEPCCEKPENRTAPEPAAERPDLTVAYCIVCGRRHFELTVDPAKIGVKIGSDAGDAE